MMKIIGWIVGIAVMLALVYGMWWLAKHGSYWLWYEDMVQGTIRELVKAEALR